MRTRSVDWSIWVRPGGIILLDDVPEPSVYTAAQDFLRISPGWRALGGLRDGLDLSDPFHSMDRATLGEVGFTVLTAPIRNDLCAAPRRGHLAHGVHALGQTAIWLTYD